MTFSTLRRCSTKRAASSTVASLRKAGVPSGAGKNTTCSTVPHSDGWAQRCSREPWRLDADDSIDRHLQQATLSHGAHNCLGKRGNYSDRATDRPRTSGLLGSAGSSGSPRRIGGELAVLAASARRNLEKDAIESCIAAGRGGRLRMDAQIVPTIKAASGIINHSKTFIDLATIPSVASAVNAQRSLDAHPGDRAVGEALLLPNRHSRLHLVDEFLARGEGLAAMS